MASGYSAKEEDEEEEGRPGGMKSRRPDNTAFRQQRLPAWQPVLTAGSVLPAFLLIGLLFIPVGIGLFVTSNNINEFQIDYTGTDMSSPCFNCSHSFSWNSSRPCTCSLPFYLEQPFESNVFVYYGLSNFYQNHRRYVKSRDDSQLNGNLDSLKSPSKECEPYAHSDHKPTAPCGAIANSMFNDTLDLFFIDPTAPGSRSAHQEGHRLVDGQARQVQEPGRKQPQPDLGLPGVNNLASTSGECTSKPVNWHKPVYELDSDPENNGFINEDFIVWMRTAALPTFRKLYRIIQKKRQPDYPVRSFDGRKRMILSTISWMGGKNPFLGVAYITVGAVCFFLGVVLLIIHHKYGSRNNSADIPN
ncbi:hypothetical protein CRUP_009528 [Coryphaenoides rupestris]|nr:hypothetical protein CRUP_009528 [Coryphaenoides rupestris]